MAPGRREAHALWSAAHADLPALIKSLQPKIGDLAKAGLGFVAGIGVGLLKFLAAFIIAGILMAFGESGGRASRAIFDRFAGRAQGAEFTRLSTATIRAVAQGVIGVAFIQAILVGLCPLVRGHTVCGRAGDDRPGTRDRTSARADRHAAGHRLHLVEGRLRECGGDHLHRAALRRGNGRQCPQAA